MSVILSLISKSSDRNIIIILDLNSELSVGMTTEGIEVRSVGNTKVISFVLCPVTLSLLLLISVFFLQPLEWCLKRKLNFYHGSLASDQTDSILLRLYSPSL